MVSVKPIVAVAMLLVLSAPVTTSPAPAGGGPAEVASATTFPLHRAGIAVHTTLSRPVAHPGDGEVQTAEVTNTGSVPVVDVRVTMDLSATCVRDIPWLLPHSSRTATCTGTAGTETRTVTAAVRGEVFFGWVVSAESTTTLRIIRPAMEVHASVLPGTTIAGQHVTYTATVANSGNATITGLRLAADGAPGCTGPLGPLAAGTAESVRCAVTAGGQGGSATFTATGRDELGGAVHASAGAHFTVVHPHLDLTVSGPDRPVARGGTATVTVRLRDTSDVAIADIHVTGRPASCRHTVGELVPGADAVYTCLVPVVGRTTVDLTAVGLPVIDGTVVTSTGFEVTETATLSLAATPTVPPPPAPTTPVPTTTSPVPTRPVVSAPALPPPTTTSPPPPPAPRPKKVVLDATAGPLRSPTTTAAVIAVLGVLMMTVSVGALKAASRPGK